MLEDVLTRGQDVFDTWGRALRLSGGALAPAKCYYTCIGYKHKRGTWSPTEDRDDLGGLIVTNGIVLDVRIRLVDHGEAIKTVGAIQALSGSETVFVKDIVKKVETVALNFWSYDLQRILT